MPGFDYGRMQKTATRLLDRFAQGVVTLKRPGTSTPGPNPWDPPVTGEPVNYTLAATVKGVSKEFIDGTTILATDLQVMTAVPEIEPSMETDIMTIDGETVTLLQIDRIPAAGTVIAYRFFVRG